MNKNTLPVFRIVDGKRVRIPGDTMDPERRYSNVNDTATGEQYMLEYTFDEERQADEDAARWKAEEPAREAEKLRQEAEFLVFRDSLKYEERIVAFIDILGWKSALNAAANDPELVKTLGVTVRAIQDYIKFRDRLKMLGGPFKDFQITHFSDTLVFSIKFDRDAQSPLITILEQVGTQFDWLGHVVRGGISVGPLLHDGSMIFGPALIAAYELEKSARYPRILLDDRLAKIWGPGQQVNVGGHISHYKHWRKDTDGKTFYDFLQPWPQMPGASPEMNRLNSDLGRKRDFIVKRLTQFANDGHVIDKYKWMASYFNLVLQEYKSSVLPIEISKP